MATSAAGRTGQAVLRLTSVLGAVAVWVLAISGCDSGRASSSLQQSSSSAVAPSSDVIGPPSTSGPVSVPNVIGKPYNTAQVELASVGSDTWLSAVYKWVHDPALLAGTVSAQSPAAGTETANGSQVTLTVSIGPAYVAGSRPCTAANLQPATGTGVSEMTGQHTIDVSLTNHSNATCQLEGYPEITMLDSRGQKLGFTYSHTGDQMTTNAKPTRLYLPSSATAWVRINKYRCDIGETDVSQTLLLGLPDNSGSLQVGTSNFSFCDESPSLVVVVSPFEPVEALLSVSGT